MAMFALVTLLALNMYWIYRLRIHKRHLKRYGHIPVVGSDNMIFSFWTAVRCLYEYPVVLEEGYRQYKGRVFRVPQLTGWLVIVSGNELIEELRKAPDHVLSAEQAQSETIQSIYTLGLSINENSYHAGVIRHSVSRNAVNLLPAVVDELVTAFPEELESKMAHGLGWTPLKTRSILLRIVARITNRMAVGLPVCRIDEYINATLQFTYNVVAGAQLLNLCPDILKPFVGELVVRRTGPQHTVYKYLAPIIQERRASRTEFGSDYAGRPNDFLSWIMDAAPLGYLSSTRELSLCTLFMNFAAILSTSLTLTNALYDLASYPEYAEPLRQEVTDCLGLDTALWTKDAIEKCCKLDSFLKESQRMNPLRSLSLSRKLVQDFTFCDGTVVPSGITVAAAQIATHRDPENYKDPDTFDGFRFCQIREKMRDERLGVEYAEDEGEWRNRFTGTGKRYLAFGGGRHVCPGRFFASMQLKCIMAFILLSYDVKMRNEGKRPASVWFGKSSIPDSKVEVMFRRRG